MAYSDFSLQDVVTEFDLVEERAKLFDSVDTLEMSEWLKETFAVSLDWGLFSSSEKARSEFIVAPILLELGKRNHGHLAVHSGKRFDVLPEKGLSGECDFILSKGYYLDNMGQILGMLQNIVMVNRMIDTFARQIQAVNCLPSS